MSYKVADFNDSLYHELLDQVKNDSLTDDNKTLLNDYIKPVLAQFVMYDGLTGMAINTTTAGLMVNSRDNSAPATNRQRADLARDFKGRANALADSFTRWIDQADVIVLYPKYSRAKNIRNFVKSTGGVITGRKRQIRIDDR